MFRVSEIIEMALRLEENGEAYYRQAAEHARSCGMPQKAVELWERLAEEEREHRKMFLEIKRSFVRGAHVDIKEKLGSWYIVEAIGNRLFSFDPACAFRASEPKDVIEIARNVEEDSIRFYEFLEQLVDNETVLLLIKRIIDEERRHIEHLDQILAGLSSPKSDHEGSGRKPYKG